MEPRSKRTRIALLALTAGVAASAILLWRRDVRSTTVPLPGGGTLTLLSARYTTNVSDLSPTWDRLLAVLPSSWLREMRTRADSRRYGEPVLFARLQQQGGDRGLGFTFADESGFEPSVLYGAKPIEFEGQFFHHLVSHNFPRRGSSALLRVYAGPVDPPLTKLVAEFPLPWPAPRDTLAWTNEPLPAVRRDGAFQVVLRELRVESFPLGAGPSGKPVQRGMATAVFQVTEPNRAPRDWAACFVSVADAARNAYQLTPPEVGTLRGAAGEFVLQFGWPLWTGETAYRLEVGFDRVPGSAFDTDELWTVEQIPVPAEDQITEVNAQTTLAGCRVDLIALVGSHASLPGREHDVFQLTTLEVDHPPLGDQRALRVMTVVDERGQPATSITQVGTHSYGFKPAAGARLVNITLALHRKPRVEFTVKPNWVKH